MEEIQTGNPVVSENETAQAQAIVPAEQKEAHHSKRPMVAAIVLLLMAVVGVVVYFLYKQPGNTTMPPVSPSPSPTLVASPEPVSLKTYTNTKYGYSVEYPSNWIVREFPDTKTGAAFHSADQPGYPDAGEPIYIDAGQKIGNYTDMPFEEYVKIAAKEEIQGYTELMSIKEVTTTAGVTGFQTTWKVQPLGSSGSAGPQESDPITYFEVPNDKTILLRISLSSSEHTDIYEQMLASVKVVGMKTASPTPVVDQSAELKTIIKKYLVQKHGDSANALNITVSKIEGNYAQGGASAVGEGGGMWFAAKEDGVWKLVWDGNGTIECSTFTLYPEFPTTMIPECYDSAEQDVVKR